MTYEIAALDALTAPAWLRFFEACGSACFCRFWHFEGKKNDWLERCAFRPDDNRDEQLALVRVAAPEGRGLLALHEGVVVGWMKLAPHESIPKLTSLPVYRALTAEPGSWVVGCFLVSPGMRREGVARALLQAAETHVCAWGGRFLLGHPRRSNEPLHDEEAWQGPEKLFLELGYTPIHDVGPYPVYRKVVNRAAT